MRLRPSATASASPNPRPLALPPDSLVTTTLQRHLLTVLATNGFLGAGTALCVYDLSTGTLIFARHSATSLRPASNEKLLTSATALARWGPTHRFATDLYEDGSLEPDGVFRGSLYLKGYGDPSLATAAYQRGVLHLRSARLADFVSAIRRAGIKRIAGRVVGDASYFDARRAVASWHEDEIDDCGPLSALSVDEGLGLRGSPVTDPALYAAATLTALVRRAGIPVSRAAATGVTPREATLLYEDRSTPLVRILASMNQRSDDFFAEMLTKGLGIAFEGKGQYGCRRDGRACLRAYVGNRPHGHGGGRRLRSELCGPRNERRSCQIAHRRGAQRRVAGLLPLTRRRRRKRHAVDAHATHGRPRATCAPRRAPSMWQAASRAT